MSTREDQINEIQESIQHAKKVVEIGKAYDRLVKNKDFQLIIDEGYMGSESRRLTLLLGDPNLSAAQKDQVVGSLKAIGEFHTYLRVQKAQAEQMVGAIAEAESVLDELHAEEAAEAAEAAAAAETGR